MSEGAEGGISGPKARAADEDLTRLPDDELGFRLDALREEELRRLGASASDPRRARFFQDTEKLAALGILARGVAHEFNNLFSGVIAHCDYALRAGDDEARTRALEVALASTREASAIVKNIQRFARQERPNQKLADPAAVVRRVLELCRPSLKTKKVRLLERLDPVPPFVMDPSAIEQVVLNLVTNAVEASERGGVVRVELSREDRLAVIAVIDHGSGIAPEHQRRLFTPFFSTKGVYARSERESRLTGTGLGLAVSYGIVRQHGGTIEVESAPGRGSTFRVQLPMGAVAAAADAMARPARAGDAAPPAAAGAVDAVDAAGAAGAASTAAARAAEASGGGSPGDPRPGAEARP